MSAITPDISVPDVSVSIVSYNTRDLLRTCLQSLRERSMENEVALEIIVADNDSHDGSVEMVEQEFPEVLLVRSGGNIGYGRANNLAFEASSGRYFFVLNSDTEVEAGALRAMRDFMDAHRNVGAVGAQLVLPDGEIQPSCATDPHLAAFFWEQTRLDRILPRNRVTGGYTMTYWDYDEPREVEQVCGACLFVRREAWQAIDGFDPAYFMYFEDTDFCVRLRRAGWPIWFLPAARIRHFLGGSSGDWATRARMIASYNRSRYYYFNRHEGRAQARLLKYFTVTGALLRLLAWTALSPFKPGAVQQIKIFRRVLRETVRLSARQIAQHRSTTPDASMP
jgi:GT2 family glycosyltransferase